VLRLDTTTRWTLRIGALLAAILVSSSTGCGDPPARQPALDLPFDRIVLVSIDTLRADHLGAYGYPRDTSAFLDELARKGVLFERAYAAMATTAPSHATIFTSLYPLQHRLLQNGLKLRDDFLTLAELVSERGFIAAGFVSTGVHFAASNLQQGFATLDEPSLSRRQNYRPADQTIDAALEWLRDLDSDARLFLFVHLYDVHTPLQPPARHLDALAPASEEERESFTRFLTQQHDVLLGSYRNSREAMLKTITAYDAEIRFVDAELRRLFETSKALGLDRRTLWIITSDHGEGLGNHLWLDHGRHIYEEQIRVPLIFYSTEQPPEPRRIPDLVEHVDLLPTIASLVGHSDALAAQPRPIQGRSLAPVLDGDPLAETERAAFIQRRSYEVSDAPYAQHRRGYELGNKYALVEERWKYIYRTIGADELYDLSSDPNEMLSLAGSIQEQRRQQMRKRLLERVEELRGDFEAERVDPETIEKLEALGYLQ
jgi:arylsulfatase A-like enzyme